MRGKCLQSALGCFWIGGTTKECVASAPTPPPTPPPTPAPPTPALNPECASMTGKGNRGLCISSSRGCGWIGSSNTCYVKATPAPPATAAPTVAPTPAPTVVPTPAPTVAPTPAPTSAFVCADADEAACVAAESCQWRKNNNKCRARV